MRALLSVFFSLILIFPSLAFSQSASYSYSSTSSSSSNSSSTSSSTNININSQSQSQSQTNWIYYYPCNYGCNHSHYVPSCGNGILDPLEECDEGQSNSNSGACTLNCKIQEQDCKGVYGGTAKVDSCNVCAGNDQSCLPCITTVNTAGQLAMDGLANDLNRLVNRATSLLKKIDAQKFKVYINRSKNQARQLYNDSWTTTWSIPETTQSCTSALCVNSSHLDLILSFNDNIDELAKLVNKVVKKAQQASGNKNLGKKLLSQSSSFANEALFEANNLSTSNSICN